MGQQVESITLRCDENFKNRIVAQCNRLGVTKTAIIKMATVKFLEEQEQEEANNAFRRVG